MVPVVATWQSTTQAAASAVGSVGIIAALIYSARQTVALTDQAELQRKGAERGVDVQRASLELRLMELTLAMDRIFLQHPHLRPYFYRGRRLRSWTSPRRASGGHFNRRVHDRLVDAVAGLRRHDLISDRDYENWRIFTHNYYEHSPTTRMLWSQYGHAYLPGTGAMFESEAGTFDID